MTELEAMCQRFSEAGVDVESNLVLPVTVARTTARRLSTELPIGSL
jgi:hypothetical protein